MRSSQKLPSSSLIGTVPAKASCIIKQGWVTEAGSHQVEDKQEVNVLKELRGVQEPDRPCLKGSLGRMQRARRYRETNLSHSE